MFFFFFFALHPQWFWFLGPCIRKFSRICGAFGITWILGIVWLSLDAHLTPPPALCWKNSWFPSNNCSTHIPYALAEYFKADLVVGFYLFLFSYFFLLFLVMICYAVSYSMLFIWAEISYLIPLHGNDVSGEVLLSTYIINRNRAQKTINAKWMNGNEAESFYSGGLVHNLLRGFG